MLVTHLKLICWPPLCTRCVPKYLHPDETGVERSGSRDFSAQISHTQPSGSMVRVLIAPPISRRTAEISRGGAKHPHIGRTNGAIRSFGLRLGFGRGLRFFQAPHFGRSDPTWAHESRLVAHRDQFLTFELTSAFGAKRKWATPRRSLPRSKMTRNRHQRPSDVCWPDQRWDFRTNSVNSSN
jgi:hypothetical protein